MTFEEKIRNRIGKSPFRSKEKELLKVVLGEVQQKSVSGTLTEDQGFSIVKSMIKNNTEKVLPYLKEGDDRRLVVIEENKILQSLLPSYLSEDEIKMMLSDLTNQIKEAKSEGQATGIAMKYLKSVNAQVEGDTVKKVVQLLRV